MRFGPWRTGARGSHGRDSFGKQRHHHSMNVNLLAKFLGDSTYGFLALNLLFGLFCAILVWRRLRELRFATRTSSSNSSTS